METLVDATHKKSGCCLKCIKTENANNVCKNDTSQAGKMNDLKDNNKANLNNWHLDFLVDYILEEHHQYYYNKEAAISKLLEDVVNHLDVHDEELQRLSCLFLNLKNILNAHFLVEEQVLFPYIKQLASAKRNSIYLKATGVKNIVSPITVMESEHAAAQEILNEISSITNNYIGEEHQGEKIELLYKNLKALHENLAEHITIEDTILYPKTLLLKDELNAIEYNTSFPY